MRYKGQGWEIPVRLDQGSFDEFAAELITGVFTKAYETFFGRAIDDVQIEAVSWSVRVSSVIPAPDPVEVIDGQSVATSDLKRPMYDPVSSTTVAASIIERDALTVGQAVDGPALIVESQTTTVLGSHHCAVLQGDRSLRITRQSAETSTREQDAQ